MLTSASAHGPQLDEEVVGPPHVFLAGVHLLHHIMCQHHNGTLASQLQTDDRRLVLCCQVFNCQVHVSLLTAQSLEVKGTAHYGQPCWS